jgi:hypothetical protein
MIDDAWNHERDDGKRYSEQNIFPKKEGTGSYKSW